MRFVVRRGRVGTSSKAFRSVGHAAPLAATLLAAALSGCELIVGTDDFVTSPDAGGGGASSASASSSFTSDSGSTSTETGEDDSGVGHDGAPGETDARASEGGKEEQFDGGEAGAEAGGGTGTCAVEATDPTCVACWKASCCSAYTACEANTDCVNIATCIQACASSPCQCTSGSSQALQLFEAMAMCGALASTADCSICPASGTGDQCNSASNCVPGLECLYDGYQFVNDDESCTPTTCAGWCSPQNECASNSDCAGSFSGGVNETGQANRCVTYDGQGDSMCFSLCAPGNSCAGVPGTTCQSDIDVEGNEIMACE